MRRPLRILILLVVLLLVAGMTLGERLWVRDWQRPLAVAIYPVALDAASAAFVAHLTPADFHEIGEFLTAEARRWKRPAMPAPQLVLQAPVREPPPMELPRGKLEAIAYSLRLRWYAFRHTPFRESLGTVRLFVLYHELKYNQALPHSLGLAKGLLGVVHVFAAEAQQAQNNVVIAHELLHTLGATDKYGADGQPLYPVGFADFTVEPRYPQSKAEIMAGRIPLAPGKAEIPKGLAETVIGYATAAEIGW
jgi:hypothetical protein